MRKAEVSDSHLEADLPALSGKPNGFEDVASIPYLFGRFAVRKDGGAQKVVGEFMPMVANDGPHYGDNVKLMGPGRYKLKLTVSPPGADPHIHFGRHVVKETGVGAWFKPFDVEYDFVYAGVGKKGAF